MDTSNSVTTIHSARSSTRGQIDNRLRNDQWAATSATDGGGLWSWL